MKKSIELWMLVAWLSISQVMIAADGGNALVIRAEDAQIKTEGGKLPAGGWNIWSNGHVGQAVKIAEGGKYTIVARAWGSKAGNVWPEMALMVDGDPGQSVTVKNVERSEYTFEAVLSKGTHELAVAFMNDALIGNEDRNLFLESIVLVPPAGVEMPQLSDGRELVEEAEKREQVIITATQQAIEKNRKSDAVVKVVDSVGKPVGGVRVLVTQTKHDFLFGCNIYEFGRQKEADLGMAYKKRFEELFNYATVGFYWRWYEEERGKPNYAYTDKVVSWCVEHGIRMKGHPLLWGDEAGVPPWSKGQPVPRIQRQRVEEIMTRYQGKIGFWEVVNEPSHLSEPKISEPYRWARQFDSSAYLVVNDYHVFADGCPAFLDLLKAAVNGGVPFDGIGIQAHEPRTMRFPLDRVQKILDRYADLGKELHITEFTPTSAGERITGSHKRGVWDEVAQADYAVKFYRVCFAHPAMRGITWWDLSDRGAWLKGGGMLRADMSPKPVYEQIRKLVHEEWKSNLSGVTDKNGRFEFRGFHGAYRITVKSDDKTLVKDCIITKKDTADIVMVFQNP